MKGFKITKAKNVKIYQGGTFVCKVDKVIETGIISTNGFYAFVKVDISFSVIASMLLYAGKIIRSKINFKIKLYIFVTFAFLPSYKKA